MAYFDSAKNRAMWNRELAQLRQEKAERAANGYKPVEKETAAAKSKAAVTEDNPRRRRINLAELERIDARAGKIRKIKRPTREHAYVKGMPHEEYGAAKRSGQ